MQSQVEISVLLGCALPRVVAHVQIHRVAALVAGRGVWSLQCPVPDRFLRVNKTKSVTNFTYDLDLRHRPLKLDCAYRTLRYIVNACMSIIGARLKCVAST